MQSKRCLICKRTKFTQKSKTVRDSKNHQILMCKSCGHTQIHPIPTLTEEKKFYDDNKQEKNLNIKYSIDEIKKKSMSDTNRRVKFVSKLVKKNEKILEIGSGYGLFLEGMKKRGQNVIGIEISKEKREIAKKITKAQILDINILEKKIKIPKVDVIVLFHVLEHISEPVKFLKNLRNMLKMNGRIVVEVPNHNDHQLQLNKKYREFYWQRAHIHYFTPKIFQKVLEESGFSTEVKGIQRYSIENFFNWKLIGKPQLDNPIFCLPEKHEWMDLYYKDKLEKSLKCDTIIAVGIKNN